MEIHISFTAAYGLTLGFMLIALCMLVVGRQQYGTFSSVVKPLTSAYLPSAVRVANERNVLPAAIRIMACACRNGFTMAHADPQYQLEVCAKNVDWNGLFLDELKRGLHACRVL